MTFQSFVKTLAVLFAVIATSVVSTPAFAAGNTWVPDFDPAKHVYVAPALENHPTRPFTLDAQFARELEQLAAKHKLDVYVIATEQGDDLTGDRKRWAPDHLHNQVWQKWSRSRAFNEGRILIIEWVRGRDNTAQMSTAARVGSAVQSYGLSRQRFFDQSGPVFTAIRAHMPQDPRACFLAIVTNVNIEIDAHLAATSKPSTPANPPTTSTPPASSDGGGSVLLWIGIVAVVAFGIIAVIVASATSHARREQEERERRMRASQSTSTRAPSPPAAPTTPPGQTPPAAPGSGEGSNAATIAGAAVAGAVVGHVLTRDQRDRRRDDSGSGTTSGADTTTPIVTGGSTCGSSSDSGSSGGGGGCGGGGCGGGGCGGGGCGGA